jgi:3-phosphoglycerate kinase
MIRSIDNAIFTAKRVLVRCDLNVPIKDGVITDSQRIEASLPTIEKIIEKGGIPILMSHLGRPKGERKPEFSLKPVAEYLTKEHGYNVNFAEDCIGDTAKNEIEKAGYGHIVLLENLRFHKEEEKNDEGFAKQIAELADAYVNDAFGTAHRAHASTEGVAKHFKDRFAGYLMLKEVEYLGEALKEPKKPFVAVIGGAKITGKIDVIQNLLDKCDSILIGGGMMFTFYKAQGLEIGKSLLEEDKIELARELIKEAEKKNTQLILPSDVVVADEFKNDANFKQVNADEIPADWIGLDIGDQTKQKYFEIIKDARTVVWNGPMGVFEMDNFAKGTLKIAEALAASTEAGGITIVGGGDSAAAIKKLNYEDKVSHVSTGGGASLEFLEGKILPGVAALEV